jgi:two-component system, chemotaxis family, protein-glutamate methylesterase/glutaminase
MSHKIHRSGVLRFDLRGGLLVCAHKSAGSGAVVLSSVTPESTLEINNLIEAVSALSSSEPLSIKLIGRDELVDEVSSMLRSKSPNKHQVTSKKLKEPNLEAYFFADSGLVRVGSADQPMRKPRVLIVDDSKTIRQILTRVLEKDFEVVGGAEKPSQVEQMIEELKPDVITLDIHMPEMDGVTLLKQYLKRFSIPTVMISSISMEESGHVLQALEAGAVDYIQKPSLEELSVVAPLIIEKVKTAASARVKKAAPTSQRKVYRSAALAGPVNRTIMVAIGSSTGGTEALREVLTQLPSAIPPIVIVQHIPAVFSLAFARRMNELCPFEVIEAKDGDELRPDRVLIAPGGFQMAIVRGSGPCGYQVQVKDAPPVNRHRPSVDVLFDSVAELAGKKAVGIILTGMGADGAKGLLKMRQRGARTIAQDEASCVVFGMPQAAIKLKAAELVRPLSEIPAEILSLLATKAA